MEMLFDAHHELWYGQPENLCLIKSKSIKDVFESKKKGKY